MKYYNYSVKNLLTDYFGEDTVFSMRRPNDSEIQSNVDKSDLIPFEWQVADRRATDLFVDSVFLIDTFLFDDYIAYTCLFGNEKLVYLMFMSIKDKYFHFDMEYAKQLVNEWSIKGYKALILNSSVSINTSKDELEGIRYSIGRGEVVLYNLKYINDNPILVFADTPFWEIYFKKIISVSLCSDIADYECLFSSDVFITYGHNSDKITLFESNDSDKITVSQGIENVKKFFFENSPVRIVYSKIENTNTYLQQLMIEDKLINIFINDMNLISEINISDSQPFYNLIIDNSVIEHINLIKNIPELIDFKVLDATQMHAFALQLNYGNGNIRNYYISCFIETCIPKSICVDGKEFSMEILNSAHLDGSGNISFINGLVIPKHILYYRSYRQVQPNYTGSILYDNNGITIKSLYKLPLTEFKGFLIISQYWGYPDECFGPSEALLDKFGNRISNISLISKSDHEYHDTGTLTVSVEPTGKYGLINNDGSWLASPVYDDIDNYSDGSFKVTRTVDDIKRTLLLNNDGKEIPFNFPLEFDTINNDRCAFNAEEWTGEKPDAGYYWDYDWVTPGKWGIIDSDGNIIVEPKYVFVAGFYNGGGNHSVVARYVDDKLCWGVIDLNGNEVIPCQYTELYSRWGKAVAFQTEVNGLYGVMDFDGTVIVEPQFGYIEEYNIEHNLVSAGEYRDKLGVFSVDSGKMIIPEEFDCIEYGERMISCEPQWTGSERYFDYSGNEFDFSEYEYVSEKGDLLEIRKDGKFGLIDWNKNVIVPPIMKFGFEYDGVYSDKGLIISEKDKLSGLTKLSGEVVIPYIYSDMNAYGPLIITSEKTDHGRCVKDSLFTCDGELIMSGSIKNIRIYSEQKIMSVETPTGIEYFEIETDAKL